MRLYKSFLFFMLISQVITAQVNNYEVGDLVDDFSVKDINSVTHNLYSYTAQGKYVYIEFSTTTCGPCQYVIPVFNEFYDKYGCNEGDIACFAVFGTSADNDENVSWFEETYGGPFQHAPAISNQGGGTELMNNFNPGSYPTICLISPDNEMLDVYIFPVNQVADLEAVFPSEFDPEPMECFLSIDESDTFKNVSIYPNPVKDQLHIHIFDHRSECTIFNTTGDQVLHKKLNDEESIIDVRFLDSGFYYVKIVNDKNTIIQKIVVSK